VLTHRLRKRGAPRKKKRRKFHLKRKRGNPRLGERKEIGRGGTHATGLEKKKTRRRVHEGGKESDAATRGMEKGQEKKKGPGRQRQGMEGSDGDMARRCHHIRKKKEERIEM